MNIPNGPIFVKHFGPLAKDEWESYAKKFMDVIERSGRDLPAPEKAVLLNAWSSEGFSPRNCALSIGAKTAVERWSFIWFREPFYELMIRVNSESTSESVLDFASLIRVICDAQFADVAEWISHVKELPFLWKLVFGEEQFATYGRRASVFLYEKEKSQSEWLQAFHARCCSDVPFPLSYPQLKSLVESKIEDADKWLVLPATRRGIQSFMEAVQHELEHHSRPSTAP
jgi:hypothetical protein